MEEEITNSIIGEENIIEVIVPFQLNSDHT